MTPALSSAILILMFRPSAVRITCKACCARSLIFILCFASAVAKEGYIMFKEAGQAASAVEKLFAEGVPECGGKTPTLSTLEGEEEAIQWREVWGIQASLQGKNKRHDNKRPRK